MTEIADLALRFGPRFRFGAATAAFQIEGATGEDGRKSSIWDTFCRQPGRVSNGDTGDIACDHYHRHATDLDLLVALGADAYRFSIAWPRVFPDGGGTLNRAGLDFYDRLLDDCCQRGLQPFATLYHWDLPQRLQDRGGWVNRATAHYFADYAAAVVDRLGDRLAAVTTFNEPWCSACLGHLYGIHAPGLADLDSTLAVIHHQNVAHGLATLACRDSRPALDCGIVINAHATFPASDRDEDHEAAMRHRDFHNGMYFGPLFGDGYPASVVDALGTRFPDGFEDDLPLIRQPLDYWGLNYYTPERVTAAGGDAPVFPASTICPPDKAVACTDIGWEIDADAFSRLLVDLHQRYNLPPCYITENGAAFNDGVSREQVADSRRIRYLEQHLAALADAIDAGVEVRGYFLWSLLDNFEWAEGYAMRFGIVHVDYATQVRTPKHSFHWYRQLIEAHRHQRG